MSRGPSRGKASAAGRRRGALLASVALASALVGCSLGASKATPAPRPTAPPTPSVQVRTPPSPPGATAGRTPTAAVGPITPATRATVSGPAPTAARTAAPDQGPTAGWRSFTSDIHPYAVRYPPGWTAAPGALHVGDVRGDVFSALARRGSGEVSVNVLSEPLTAADTDTEAYVRLTVEQLRKSGVTSPARAGEARVAGNRAVLLTWTDISRPLRTYEITQAVWSADGRGWVVTLANPRGERARYLPVLRGMLGTFAPR